MNRARTREQVVRGVTRSQIAEPPSATGRFDSRKPAAAGVQSNAQRHPTQISGPKRVAKALWIQLLWTAHCRNGIEDKRRGTAAIANECQDYNESVDRVEMKTLPRSASTAERRVAPERLLLIRVRSKQS